MTAARVLVVDDDPDIRDLLREMLRRAGYEVGEAADGREALRLLHESPPELVLLDVAMPGMDGWQALARLRAVSDVPVVMLTARDTELEKVRGLRAGADDYVTKPFGRQELLARVQALLRRAAPAVAPASPLPPDGIYEDAYLRMDPGNAEVTVAGVPALLTPLELRLLSVFVRHRDQLLSREQILELVWGPDGAAPGQVKLYVGYLRRKLEKAAGRRGTPIETVRGFGYRYRASSGP